MNHDEPSVAGVDSAIVETNAITESQGDPPPRASSDTRENLQHLPQFDSHQLQTERPDGSTSIGEKSSTSQHHQREDIEHLEEVEGLSCNPRCNIPDAVDTPGAGPSSTSPSAGLPVKTGPYQTIVGSGSRRSLRFENSKTSFLDVTEEISDVSKYPVSEGGFCDVHEGYMKGEGKVALKRLRVLGSEVKVRKVRAFFVPLETDAELTIARDSATKLKFGIV